MSAHTPGPWHLAERDTRNLPHSLVCADTLLARVYSKHFGDVIEEQANASLIAAAPDLLEAAKLVLAWYEAENDHTKVPDFYDRIEMCRVSENAIRSGIAKATGGAA